jgi:hypothetical protein
MSVSTPSTSERSRNATLQRKYGISEAQYAELLAAQHGVCAICGHPQRYQRLAVDHCHRTKRVRGLLCVQCNRGLGRFFDSTFRLANAIKYLERSSGTNQTESSGRQS